MHSIEFPDLNRTEFIPEELNEFTNDQFVFLTGKLLELYNKKISEHDFYTELVLKLLNISQKGKYKYLPDEVKELISENVSRIAGYLQYLFITDGNTLKINYTSVSNFVPVLRSFWLRKLFGPADALTDITFREYKDANMYYNQYLESADESDLNRMIAVLYRPRNIFGKKTGYNPDKVDKRAKRLARIPLKYRFAIYLFIIACERFFSSGEVNIDGNHIDLKILYDETLKEKQLKQKRKQKYEVNTGLAGIAFSLAGTGIFGAIENVYQQNWYDIILLLYKQRLEYLNDIENLKND